MSTHSVDFPTKMGPLGICLRLKRIAEQMSQDARRVYAEVGLDIEPGWHSIFLLLEENPDGLGVAQIARALGISQPSASVAVKQMASREYVEQADDPDDRRRKIVRLSERARQALPSFHAVWSVFRACMSEVLASTDANVEEVIGRLEIALRRQSMDERVLGRIHREPVG